MQLILPGEIRQMTGPFASVIEAAQAAEKEAGIPASVTLAQWALESDFGRAMPLHSNNPFGIKAIAGQAFVEAWTHEVYHGVTKRVLAKFAAFPSISAAFVAHAKIFYNGHYQRALENLDNPDEFAESLTGVYATDPHYGTKLIGLMKKYNLYQYDGEPNA